MKDDETLQQYLLGTLDEEQADNLERRLLLESDLFELAEAVEGDLLAAAARGDLSPAERGRVLRRLASSPEGRARYALIRGLTSLDREPVPAEVRVFELLSRPAFRAAAMAASLAFVAGGFWLATQTAVPGEKLQMTTRRPTATESRAPSPVPAMPPAGQIAERSPAPTTPVSPGREPSARPKVGPLLFELALTTVRSAGETPRLEIPRGTSRVEIRLPLNPDEPLTSLAAILRNATGDEIQRKERLAAREVDGRKMVVLSVSAADLAPGTYEVEVRGITDGEDELLGQRTFEVVASN